MSSNPYGRLEYSDGRIMPGVWLASGHGYRPGWKPYRWRDPSASARRTALAAAIRASIGAEPDVWDSPPPMPVQRRPNSGLPWLMGCGTSAAYRRHLRHGEKPCAACTEANRKKAP